LDILIEIAVNPRQDEAIKDPSQPTNPVTPDWRFCGEQDERTEE
jgi:hypothetical protein